MDSAKKFGVCPDFFAWCADRRATAFLCRRSLTHRCQPSSPATAKGCRKVIVPVVIRLIMGGPLDIRSAWEQPSSRPKALELRKADRNKDVSGVPVICELVFWLPPPYRRF